MKVFVEISLYDMDETTGENIPRSLTPEEQNTEEAEIMEALDRCGYPAVNKVWFIDEAEAELFESVLDEA